jgi:hypothetical protein
LSYFSKVPNYVNGATTFATTTLSITTFTTKAHTAFGAATLSTDYSLKCVLLSVTVTSVIMLSVILVDVILADVLAPCQRIRAKELNLTIIFHAIMDQGPVS